MALHITKNCEYVIYCDNCSDQDFIQDCDGEYRATDTPSKFFKRHGWREINGKTLCPECAKKTKGAQHE